MTPIAAILEMVRGLGGSIKTGDPMAVLEAITPLLLEFATSDLILTPDTLFEVQSRVHAALRRANLIQAVDLGTGETGGTM